jgi:hypothetical protein
MTQFSERAVLAAAKTMHPEAFGKDAHPVATRDALAATREVLSAAVLAETLDRTEAAQSGRHFASDDAIMEAAKALAVSRGFTMPADNLEFFTPRSKIGMALADAKTSLNAVFFNQDITRDNRALGDAFTASLYLVDRYRRLHEGKSVRDLDEAESSLRTRLARVGVAHPDFVFVSEEIDELSPAIR